LDWERLGKLAVQYQAPIAAFVAEDTRKLYSTEAFSSGVSAETLQESGFRGPAAPPAMSLKQFAEGRRAYLLGHPEVRKAAATR
jgi:hypothetical protein